jgi:hypothetical protein
MNTPDPESLKKLKKLPLRNNTDAIAVNNKYKD